MRMCGMVKCRPTLAYRVHFDSINITTELITRYYSGGGPGVVVSTAAFHARVRGSVPGLGGLKETKLFLPHPRVKVSIVGSLRDREVACSASDRQGSNFASCVWRTVSSQSSHHPQEVLLAQFSLYVHKGGLKPDSFHFLFTRYYSNEKLALCSFNVSPTSATLADIKPTFGECAVFAGKALTVNMQEVNCFQSPTVT